MEIDNLLKIAIEKDASDLHLKVGNYPMVRVYGELAPLAGLEKLTPEDINNLSDQLMTEHQKTKLEKELDVDFAYSLTDFGRFRVNIYYQQENLSIVLRIIPLEIKTIGQLLLPEILEKVSLEKRGLVLVTGTTGSGKTTTLASMIDHINTHRRENIITIEDPIEFIHRDKSSIITQREVGVDVKSYSSGLISALREDPDIILVGEMRRIDTIETAILAAETGHLVLSTLHTLDAPETVDRIVTVFPPHYQKQIRLQLSSILKAVISMRLIPRQDGKGRVPAVEVMVNTPYIQGCIREKERMPLIRDAIAAGVSQYGMQTFDQSIYALYKKEYISFEEGMRWSSSPENFKLRVMGIQSSADVAKEDMEKKMGEYDRETKKIDPTKLEK